MNGRRQGGYMLLAVLIMVVLAGVAATQGAEVWATRVRRDKEEQLLYVGAQYAHAIERYYYATPSARRELPDSLDVLLHDDRFPMPVRHLRELYPDPLMPATDWGVVRIGGKVVGVYSMSQGQPLKKAGFERPFQEFAAATTFQDWKFVFHPPVLPWTGSQLPNVESTPGRGSTAPAPGTPGRNDLKGRHP